MVPDVNDEYVYAHGGKCYKSWEIMDRAKLNVRCPRCDKVCKDVDSYASHYASVHVPWQ